MNTDKDEIEKALINRLISEVKSQFFNNQKMADEMRRLLYSAGFKWAACDLQYWMDARFPSEHKHYSTTGDTWIGRCIDQLVEENIMLQKRDFAVICQYLKDEGIYPKLQFRTFATMIPEVSHTPGCLQPSEDSIKKVIFKGKYPLWEIDIAGGTLQPTDKQRMMKVAQRFDAIYRQKQQ